MSLGGNVIAVREELTPSPARMSTPSAGQHGRHGIRYHQSYSDSCLEDIKQEEVGFANTGVSHHFQADSVGSFARGSSPGDLRVLVAVLLEMQ